MKEFIIRREMPTDQRNVENLVRESFWNIYRPGCLEHYVIHCLRNDNAFIPQLDFIMTVNQEEKEILIGQIICMKAEIKLDNGISLPIMTLGPICIHPNYKRQGYGKALLDYTLKRAADLSFGAVCLEGNINFYGKSGFTYASEFGIRYHGLPESEDTSFFLCKELKPGFLNDVTGEYTTPKGYFIDEAECDRFDAAFPKKEKMRLPGQLW